jgi:hypothetical protein
MAASTELLNKLFTEYGLTKDDVFISPQYKIIARSGVDKIQAKAGIRIKYDMIYNDDWKVYIKATGVRVFRDEAGRVTSKMVMETYGEATITKTLQGPTKTSAQGQTVVGDPVTINGSVRQNPPYLTAMAEKRAMSRVVLKLAGLYAEGFYGEDEADDFGDTMKKYRKEMRQASEGVRVQ